MAMKHLQSVFSSRNLQFYRLKSSISLASSNAPMKISTHLNITWNPFLQLSLHNFVEVNCIFTTTQQYLQYAIIFRYQRRQLPRPVPPGFYVCSPAKGPIFFQFASNPPDDREDYQWNEISSESRRVQEGNRIRRLAQVQTVSLHARFEREIFLSHR